MKRMVIPLLLAACGDSDLGLIPEELEGPAALARNSPCLTETDDGNDGTIDTRVTIEWIGMRMIQTHSFADGSELVALADFDHAGRIIYAEDRYDGVVAVTNVIVYDATGRRQRFEGHTGEAWGGPEDSVETVTAWTDAGRDLESHTTFSSGAPGYTTRWSYDAYDRKIGRVETWIDGTERNNQTVVYDDAARTRLTVVTGMYGYRLFVRYNDAGRPVHRENGYGSSSVELTWDGDELVSEEESFVDGTTSITRYRYDCE
jgi:YD repeat-containing protein